MTGYCRSLFQEMILWGTDSRIQGKEVNTVFIGGGTPSFLSIENISLVLEGLYNNFTIAEDAEITLECNPGTVTEKKLRCYRQFGVNRLSIGLQSAIDSELEMLGRIHTWQEFRRTFEMARECGFDNINIDVMAAIPEQTIESYCATLQRVLELKPEHISAYSLIIEEGTPFYEKYAEEPPVEEETDRQMYRLTEEKLVSAGYARYEISNYAKEGYSCSHNIKYWRRGEYLGLGLGAASFLSDDVSVRFSNTRLFETYEREVRAGRKPIAEREILSKDDEMTEFMFLGLRCMKGISKREFEACFHVSLKEVYGSVIEELKAQALLKEDGEWITLTRRGIDVSNVVFAKFI